MTWGESEGGRGAGGGGKARKGDRSVGTELGESYEWIGGPGSQDAKE